MDSDVKMEKWIRERIETLPAAHYFVLVHASSEFGGMGGEPLLRLSVGEDAMSGNAEAEATNFSKQVLEHARNHVDAFDGLKQRYKIFANDDEERVIAAYPFQLGSRMASHAVDHSEMPTDRGLLAQLMRHNDRKDELFMHLSQGVFGALISENQNLRAQRDKAEETRAQYYELTEELVSRKHERELEISTFQREEGRKDQLVKALITTYGPEILKQLNIPKLLKGGGGANGAAASAGGAHGAHGTHGSNGHGAATHATAQTTAGESGGSAGPTAESERVAEGQAAIRGVFKLLDRHTLFETLDRHHRAMLDDCLGLGSDPSTVGELAEKLSTVWAELPEESTDIILSKLPEVAPEHTVLLAEMLRGNVF